MQRFFVVLTALCMLAFASSAQATTYDPEGGWWWNPAASGRGFDLEVQGDILVIAVLSYDASGNPNWYTGGGPIVSNRFSGTLQRFSGGQCVGCSYTAPSVSGNSGPVSITFTSDTTATVTMGGNTFPIRRFEFGYTDTLDRLKGGWIMVNNDSSRSANKLVFSGRTTLPDGTPALIGETTLGTPQVNALAAVKSNRPLNTSGVAGGA